MKNLLKQTLQRFNSHVGLSAAVLLFSFSLLAIVWGAVIVHTRFEQQQTIATATKRNANLAIAFEQYAGRAMNSADATTRYVKREYERAGTTIDIVKLVADLSIDEKYFASITIFGADGYAIATTVNPRPKSPINILDRDHFRVHQQHDHGRLYIGKPLQSRVLDRLIVPVTRRINNPDGSFGGIVVVLITPAFLTALYKDAEVQQGDIVSLVGLDGIVRARLRGKQDSSLENFSESRIFLEQAQHPVGSYVDSAKMDGVRRFYSYRTLANYPLIAVVTTPESEVLGAFFQRKNRYLQSAVATTIFILFFSILLLLVLARKRQAVAKLVSSEARLAATFNQAATGIAYTGLDGEFLLTNQKLSDMLGYTREELTALTYFDITHPDDIERSKKFLHGFLSSTNETAASELEKRYIRKDGSVLWVALAASLVDGGTQNERYFVALLQDISDRKFAEEQMHFQAHLLATVGQAVIATNLEGAVTYWNRFAEKLYGWDVAEAVGRNMVDLITTERSQPQAVEMLSRLNGGRLWSGEFQARNRDGMQFMVQAAYSPIVNETAQLIGVISISSDITERKLAENQLRESEARFKSISANIPGMVFQLRLSADGTIWFTYVSAGAMSVCGLSPEKLHEDSAIFFALLQAGDRQSFFNSMDYSKWNLVEWDWEGQLALRGDDVRGLHLRATPRRINVATVIWDGVIFDVTEARQRQSDLDQSHAMVRALSAHQVAVKEEERKRIAREIHDELGQRLTVLRMDVLMLPKAIGTQAEPLTGVVNSMRDTIDEILLTVRNIASELRPPALDIGLVFGLEWLLEEFQASLGIPCKFNNRIGYVINLDDERATGIFRILQESLTNIARHAHPGRIDVSIDVSDNFFILEVKDDGVGFNTESTVSYNSYGLVGMRERATMMGGKISIISTAGVGTVVLAYVPL